MRAIGSLRPRGRGVRALAAAVTAVMAGMTAGLWPPVAGDAAAAGVTRVAGSWGRAIKVPGLGALNTGGLAEVMSVSCGSAGNCAAGGFYFTRTAGHGFVAVERDGVWGRAAEVPGLAALNTGRDARVFSVSCGSAGNCAAGGFYTDSGGGHQGFVAVEQHGVWGTAIEVPGLAALNTNRDAEVFSVSCASAGNCVAGGKYVGGSHLHGFVAGERNGVWGKAAEVPGLAALDGGGDATVLSVSCASAGNCAAGGSYHIDHHHQGFVADERNGRWGTAIAVPGLAALNTGGQAIVNTVSCAKAGSCAAGGAYRDRHFHSRAFVAVEQNGVWRRAIGVPGLGTLNKGGNAQVTSVSCGAAGDCAAGGNYLDQHGHEQGFVAAERHGRWGQAIAVPGLRALNTGGLGGVTSVSCASAGNCAAGGGYNRRGLQGFVAVERNGRWGTAIEVPGLAALNTGGNALVQSVSCAPTGTCAAGGDYADAPDNFQGFVVNQTG